MTDDFVLDQTTGIPQTMRVRWKNMGDGTYALVEYNGANVRTGGSDVDDSNPLSVTLIAGDDLQPVAITGSYNPNLDAFNRLRVSGVETLFESQLQYNAAPLFWDSILTGSGTATHVPDEAAVRMRCTTASGDKVVRQTRQYIRYQPGKSQLILATFVMGSAKSNVRKRIGYFDDSDGLFLEQTSSGLSFVRRTSTSGSAVDNSVAQADWNIDMMDGSGDSGIALDMSKSQILVADIEWLGVGRVRMGFVVDGIIYYAHEFLNTNVLTQVYMKTANLPVRYEIENTDTAASNTDMYQICAAVASEGGRQEKNLSFSYINTASRSVTDTPLPILSIRVGTEMPSGSGSGITNRETIYPQEIQLYTEDAAIAFWLVYNGSLTGASFANFNTTHSGVQYDISATAISGGVQIAPSGYIPATNQNKASVVLEVATDLAGTLNAAGTVGDIFTIVCQRLTGTSSDTWAGISWQELY